MTREIAKRIVKGITDKIECNTADIDDWAEFWGFTREEYEEFLDMPIKALEQEPFITKPCVSEKVCEHDKNKVLDKIRSEIEQNAYPIVHGVNNHEKGMTLYGILQVIDKYKAESEPQPKTGHWVWCTDEKHYKYCKCSQCGMGMGHTEYDFCPNCGADMREVEK